VTTSLAAGLADERLAYRGVVGKFITAEGLADRPAR
jgi:hypothetical protein